MNNKRQKVRKHISAAKDWLGRAENSMDRDNDVRGDLDMMLAQAELQRAQETKLHGGWRRWLVRLAPLLLSILVGIGYAFFLQQERPVPPGIPSEAVSPDKGEMPQLAPEIKPQEELPPANNVRYDYDRVYTTSPEPPQVTPVDREPKGPAEAASESDSHGSMPGADMQKLMQSAGKTLRE